MSLQLDHLFCFIEPDGTDVARLEALGFQVTYRRAHVGQGTANACFVFENAYLELLWVDSEEAARSSPIARTRLWERSRWRHGDGCPFGIAWRGELDSARTWPFTPPYLPAGVAISVAVDSDDAQQPMMFSFPGSQAPSQWPASRHLGFQRAGGWTRIEAVELIRPSAASAPTLEAIAASMQPPVTLHTGAHHAVRLKLGRVDGPSQWLSWPDLTLS
jgi:hypothetical protein